MTEAVAGELRKKWAVATAAGSDSELRAIVFHLVGSKLGVSADSIDEADSFGDHGGNR